MKKLYLLLLIFVFSAGACLILWDFGSALAENPKNWIHESEFTPRSNIRATSEHTVVLHLQKGTSFQRNVIPYVFRERAEHNFCIDEDDPLIHSMKLVNFFGRTVARVNRKNRCVKKAIRPGMYRMHVYHNGKTVDSDAMHGFIHVKKAPLPLGANNPWKSLSPTAAGEGGASQTTTDAGRLNIGSGLWSVEAVNGNSLSSWVFDYKDPQSLLADPVAPTLYLQLQDHDYTFPCSDGVDNPALCCFTYPLAWPSLPVVRNDDGACNYGPNRGLTYTKRDSGDYNFGLEFQYGFYEYSIGWLSLMGDGTIGLGGAPSVTDNSLFTIATIDFLPAEQVTPYTLQKGMLALYSGPNCSGTATVVLPGSHQVGRIRGDYSFYQSARVAHDTRATVHVTFPQIPEPEIVMEGHPLECRKIGEYYFVDTAKVEYTEDILISSRQCRYCDLAGLSLQNMTLDNVDLSYSYLVNTQFNNSSLKGANLSHAVLAGADLSYANLKGANLCNAFLNSNPESPQATNLYGAYMKNVNLYGANLTGATMTFANFYSSDSASSTCDGSSCGFTNCSTASGAMMYGAQINNAYLTGVDFSAINAKGVNFSGSILTGANFRNATMNTDPSSGASTSFTQSFLQGTDFTGASLSGALFNSAYVDLDTSDQTKDLNFEIKGDHVKFVDFWKDPNDSICVKYGYKASKRPATDSSNTCPDGSHPDSSGCTDTAWTSPKTPMEQGLQQAGFDICDPFTEVDSVW